MSLKPVLSCIIKQVLFVSVVNCPLVICLFLFICILTYTKAINFQHFLDYKTLFFISFYLTQFLKRGKYLNYTFILLLTDMDYV